MMIKYKRYGANVKFNVQSIATVTQIVIVITL